MNKKHRLIIFLVFLQIYIIMIIYNFLRSSQWVLDNTLSLFFLILIFSLNKWLKLGRVSFILFNLALITHNLGMFGFYNWQYGIIGYDNVVHFVSSFTAAYIVFNFIARKLHVKKQKHVEKTVIDEHIVILIFLVISSVAMLGVGVEFLEFFGYSYLGAGDGIFFVGAGDSGGQNALAGEYVDTMTDMVVNTLGSIFGVLIYYFFRYKKMPWLKYA